MTSSTAVQNSRIAFPSHLTSLRTPESPFRTVRRARRQVTETETRAVSLISRPAKASALARPDTQRAERLEQGRGLPSYPSTSCRPGSGAPLFNSMRWESARKQSAQMSKPSWIRRTEKFLQLRRYRFYDYGSPKCRSPRCRIGSEMDDFQDRV